MLFGTHAVLVRGGGDLATGVISRLHHAGFPVGVTELEHPLTVRRNVAVSSAVYEGVTDVQGLVARHVTTASEWRDAIVRTQIPVVVNESIPPWLPRPTVLVDARLAKRNIDTTKHDGSLVIGLGPGFVAGDDCHLVVETMRGHRLGRVITKGSAAPDTGTPGIVAGRGAERVIRSPADGTVMWRRQIGETVVGGDVLGAVDGIDICAPFDGMVRGLIHPRRHVTEGLKIGDIDTRCDMAVCFEISDKALAVGGGVLTAVLGWLNSMSAA